MSTDSRFLFHPIGQGGFYSGIINSGLNRQMSFVYDCGSLSPRHVLDHEIDRFKKVLGTTLDVLIISHFDADHVNGIERLLKGVQCKRLIIPYLQQEERLLIYATAEVADEERNGYRTMLRDPVAYFSNKDEFNVDEIVIIDGPDESTGEENLPFPAPTARENSPSENGPFLDYYRKYEAESKRNTITDEEQRLQDKEFTYVYAPYIMEVAKAFWEFVFYVKKFDKPLLFRDFAVDVQIIMNRHDISVYELFDDEYLPELKEKYRKISADLNNTSLVTYHGSLNDTNHGFYFDKTNDLWRRDGLSMRSRSLSDFPKRPGGTLLTGDIDINGKIKVKKLLRYFGDYIDKTLIFQVPHHGSRHNWYITPSSQLHSFSEYIINHGLGREHPHFEVVDDIKAKGKKGTLHFTNEYDCFFYWLFVY